MVYRLLLLFTFFIINQNTTCRDIPASSFKMNSRLSFYSYEKSFEMILHIPASLSGVSLNITLKINDKNLTTWKGIPNKKTLRIPFESELAPSVYIVTADINSSNGIKYSASANLTILNYKSNEVKTDNLTGGLVVSRREFFPFGFYCYSPVHSTLPEEEVVKGFNMMSPYQKILPETISERKAYMDRCAQLGMKVHYNLLSVSGGGGVASGIKGISEEKKRETLLSEIKSFMNHPALLAWYIADEPNGYKIPPEQLEQVYRIVKETDPWHPVSMVFMAPFLTSRRYADALDIVIADPYPVPNGPVTQTGEAAGQLRSEFYGKKPVWIVPQAFGGGEWWSREPSLQEIRSMTYQSIAGGARGIQYFVREGLNSFPKSTAMWNECGKMALEIAEITPWLLSDEETINVTSESKDIRLMSAVHDRKLMIMAVNTVNSPEKAGIRINGLTGGSVKVLFENRSVTMSSGFFSDYIPAYGSQVYLINTGQQKESEKPYKGNMIKDPGFEDIYSPGVPASCYAWNEGDRGATYFLDSREHFEGGHSLRLTTPKENEGSRLRFFPVNVSKGRTYILSIRAKADAEYDNPENNINGIPYFEIGLGDYGKEKFTPGNEWQQFVTSVTIPADSIPSSRVNVILRMPGKGVAWFDMLQVFETVDIRRSINPEFKKLFEY
jgi:hypothetical protein